MKRSPVAGTLLLALAAAIAIYYFVFARRLSNPPPAFAALEITTAGATTTPTCYSLNSLLAANGLSGDAPRVWTERVKDEWTLRVGRRNTWRTYTFRRENDLVVPMMVVSSDDLPQISMERVMDQWLKLAKEKNAMRVSRCK
jgi:hypothetical protein